MEPILYKFQKLIMKIITRINAEPMSQPFNENYCVGMSQRYAAFSLQREAWNAQRRSIANNYMMFSYVGRANTRILTHSQNR